MLCVWPNWLGHVIHFYISVALWWVFCDSWAIRKMQSFSIKYLLHFWGYRNILKDNSVCLLSNQDRPIASHSSKITNSETMIIILIITVFIKSLVSKECHRFVNCFGTVCILCMVKIKINQIIKWKRWEWNILEIIYLLFANDWAKSRPRTGESQWKHFTSHSWNLINVLSIIIEHWNMCRVFAMQIENILNQIDLTVLSSEIFCN